MLIYLSKKAVDFIICQEITSPVFYEKHKDQYGKSLANPIWPGGSSGVTIGVGYDLGYHTMGEIVDSWFNWVSQDTLKLLKSVQGITGKSAQLALKGNEPLREVIIPYQAAYHVFKGRTLPKYIKQALEIYPGLHKLLPDAAGSLVSMVFNRGNSLNGDRRKEMRAIVDMVADLNYEGIALEIDKSKRLWQGQGLYGIIVRREGEAKLVLNAGREYKPDELEVFEV